MVMKQISSSINKSKTCCNSVFQIAMDVALFPGKMKPKYNGQSVSITVGVNGVPCPRRKLIVFTELVL